MRVQTFCVEGFGEFPIDMLRYDCCYPSSQEAVRQMSKAGEKRKVIIERHVRTAADKPTERRWESFGWTVTGIEVTS